MAPYVRLSIRWVPRESLDAPEDLPKEPPRQMAFGQLEDVVPGMPDEAPTGLAHPLLQANAARLHACAGDGSERAALDFQGGRDLVSGLGAVISPMLCL